MPLIINTNVMSMNAQRHLAANTNALSKSMERLASGFRINKAGDDAAGLQLSENLRAQIRGSKKSLDNTQDAINVLNIADGAMQTIQNNLQRVRELLVQAANDTYAPAQRAAIVQEIEQLMQDNDRIANSTSFNGVDLLNANVPAAFDPANGTGGFWIQVGPDSDQPMPAPPIPATANVNRIDIAPALVDLTSTGALMAPILDPDGDTTNVSGDPTWTGDSIFDGTNLVTFNGDLDGDNTIEASEGDNVIDSNVEAQVLLERIDAVMTELNSRRGNLGALVNRLEGVANNLSISIENLSASESRIRNVDVAAESAELIRNQILQQASNTILAQSNQAPSLALQLLQGG